VSWGEPGRSTATLAVGPTGILPVDCNHKEPGRMPGLPTGKMPVLQPRRPRVSEQTAN